jgi:hypothetical protein
MLSDQTDTLIPYLVNLGLSHEEAQIYLYLCANCQSSALAISRSLRLSRTKVYRLLDTLKVKNLVTFELGSRGILFAASAPTALELLLTQKKESLRGIESGLEKAIKQLSAIGQSKTVIPKPIYYEGVAGLLAVTWNTLAAGEGGLRIYELLDMTGFIPYSTAEEIRREFVRKHIKIRQLTNISRIQDYTDVTEILKPDMWELRYIDPKLLAITFEIAIYNDVVAMYTYREKVPYCVELHDKDLADMHKSQFDLVWNTAKPMKVTSPRGAAEVAGVKS